LRHSSYTTKVRAAFGATLRQFGTIPLKKPATPSFLRVYKGTYASSALITEILSLFDDFA
jgi:hypothetical protein